MGGRTTSAVDISGVQVRDKPYLDPTNSASLTARAGLLVEGSQVTLPGATIRALAIDKGGRVIRHLVQELATYFPLILICKRGTRERVNELARYEVGPKVPYMIGSLPILSPRLSLLLTDAVSSGQRSKQAFGGQWWLKHHAVMQIRTPIIMVTGGSKMGGPLTARWYKSQSSS